MEEWMGQMFLGKMSVKIVEIISIKGENMFFFLMLLDLIIMYTHIFGNFGISARFKIMSLAKYKILKHKMLSKEIKGLNIAFGFDCILGDVSSTVALSFWLTRLFHLVNGV